MSRLPALLAAPLLLAACSGVITAEPGGATAPPPVAGAAPGSGACVAPAIVVDAAGKPTEVKTGFAPAGGGACVPASDLTTRPADVVSVYGGYRVTLESPTGRPDSAVPNGRLRVTVRSATGGQSAVVDAQVRLVLFHVAMGGGHGFDPNGVVTTRDAGGYVLDPIAWPMAGLWLVSAVIKPAGGGEDIARFAVDVK